MSGTRFIGFHPGTHIPGTPGDRKQEERPHQRRGSRHGELGQGQSQGDLGVWVKVLGFTDLTSGCFGQWGSVFR